MDEKKEVERLIALIERLVDENMWLCHKLAERQVITTTGVKTVPLVDHKKDFGTTTPTTDPLWRVTCASEGTS